MVVYGVIYDPPPRGRTIQEHRRRPYKAPVSVIYFRRFFPCPEWNGPRGQVVGAWGHDDPPPLGAEPP